MPPAPSSSSSSSSSSSPSSTPSATVSLVAATLAHILIGNSSSPRKSNNDTTAATKINLGDILVGNVRLHQRDLGAALQRLAENSTTTTSISATTVPSFAPPHRRRTAATQLLCSDALAMELTIDALRNIHAEYRQLCAAAQRRASTKREAHLLKLCRNLLKKRDGVCAALLKHGVNNTDYARARNTTMDAWRAQATGSSALGALGSGFTSAADVTLADDDDDDDDEEENVVVGEEQRKAEFWTTTSSLNQAGKEEEEHEDDSLISIRSGTTAVSSSGGGGGSRPQQQQQQHFLQGVPNSSTTQSRSSTRLFTPTPLLAGHNTGSNTNTETRSNTPAANGAAGGGGARSAASRQGVASSSTVSSASISSSTTSSSPAVSSLSSSQAFSRALKTILNVSATRNDDDDENTADEQDIDDFDLQHLLDGGGSGSGGRRIGNSNKNKKKNTNDSMDPFPFLGGTNNSNMIYDTEPSDETIGAMMDAIYRDATTTTTSSSLPTGTTTTTNANNTTHNASFTSSSSSSSSSSATSSTLYSSSIQMKLFATAAARQVSVAKQEMRNAALCVLRGIGQKYSAAVEDAVQVAKRETLASAAQEWTEKIQVHVQEAVNRERSSVDTTLASLKSAMQLQLQAKQAESDATILRIREDANRRINDIQSQASIDTMTRVTEAVMKADSVWKARLTQMEQDMRESSLKEIKDVSRMAAEHAVEETVTHASVAHAKSLQACKEEYDGKLQEAVAALQAKHASEIETLTLTHNAQLHELEKAKEALTAQLTDVVARAEAAVESRVLELTSVQQLQHETEIDVRVHAAVIAAKQCAVAETEARVRASMSGVVERTRSEAKQIGERQGEEKLRAVTETQLTHLKQQLHDAQVRAEKAEEEMKAMKLEDQARLARLQTELAAAARDVVHEAETKAMEKEAKLRSDAIQRACVEVTTELNVAHEAELLTAVNTAVRDAHVQHVKEMDILKKEHIVTIQQQLAAAVGKCTLEFETRVQHIRDEHEVFSKKMQQQIKDLSSTRDSLEIRLQTSAARNSQLEATTTQLEQALNTAYADALKHKQEYESTLHTQGVTIDVLTQDRDAQVLAASQEVRKQSEKIEELEACMERMKHDHSHLLAATSAETTSAASEIATLWKEKENAETALAHAREENEAKILQLRETIQVLHEKLELAQHQVEASIAATQEATLSAERSLADITRAHEAERMQIQAEHTSFVATLEAKHAASLHAYVEAKQQQQQQQKESIDAAAQSEIAVLRKQVQSLSSELDSTKASLQETESLLEANKREASHQIVQVTLEQEQQMAVVTKKCMYAEQALEEARATIAATTSATASTSQQQQQQTTLTAEGILQMETQLESSYALVASLKEELAQATTTITSLQATLDAEHTQRVSAEESVAAASASRRLREKTSEDRLLALTMQLEQSTREALSYKAQLATLKEDTQSLEADMKEIREASQEWRKDAIQAVSERNALKKEFSAVQASHENLQVALDQATKQVFNLENSLRVMESERDASTRDAGILGEALDAEREKLDQAITAARTETDSAWDVAVRAIASDLEAFAKELVDITENGNNNSNNNNSNSNNVDFATKLAIMLGETSNETGLTFLIKSSVDAVVGAVCAHYTGQVAQMAARMELSLKETSSRAKQEALFEAEQTYMKLKADWERKVADTQAKFDVELAEARRGEAVAAAAAAAALRGKSAEASATATSAATTEALISSLHKQVEEASSKIMQLTADLQKEKEAHTQKMQELVIQHKEEMERLQKQQSVTNTTYNTNNKGSAVFSSSDFENASPRVLQKVLQGSHSSSSPAAPAAAIHMTPARTSMVSTTGSTGSMSNNNLWLAPSVLGDEDEALINSSSSSSSQQHNNDNNNSSSSLARNNNNDTNSESSAAAYPAFSRRRDSLIRQSQEGASFAAAVASAASSLHNNVTTPSRSNNSSNTTNATNAVVISELKSAVEERDRLLVSAQEEIGTLYDRLAEAVVTIATLQQQQQQQQQQHEKNSESESVSTTTTTTGVSTLIPTSILDESLRSINAARAHLGRPIVQASTQQLASSSSSSSSATNSTMQMSAALLASLSQAVEASLLEIARLTPQVESDAGIVVLHNETTETATASSSRKQKMNQNGGESYLYNDQEVDLNDALEALLDTSTAEAAGASFLEAILSSSNSNGNNNGNSMKSPLFSASHPTSNYYPHDDAAILLNISRASGNATTSGSNNNNINNNNYYYSNTSGIHNVHTEGNDNNNNSSSASSAASALFASSSSSSLVTDKSFALGLIRMRARAGKVHGALSRLRKGITARLQAKDEVISTLQRERLTYEMMLTQMRAVQTRRGSTSTSVISSSTSSSTTASGGYSGSAAVPRPSVPLQRALISASAATTGSSTETGNNNMNNNRSGSAAGSSSSRGQSSSNSNNSNTSQKMVTVSDENNSTASLMAGGTRIPRASAAATRAFVSPVIVKKGHPNTGPAATSMR